MMRIFLSLLALVGLTLGAAARRAMAVVDQVIEIIYLLALDLQDALTRSAASKN